MSNVFLGQQLITMCPRYPALPTNGMQDKAEDDSVQERGELDVIENRVMARGGVMVPVISGTRLGMEESVGPSRTKSLLIGQEHCGVLIGNTMRGEISPDS